MRSAPVVGVLAVLRRLAAAVIGFVCLSTVASAVDRDKALLVAGTDAAQRLIGGRMKAVEGRSSVSSDSEVAFDAGRDRRLVIPYGAVSQLQYGVDVPGSGKRKGVIIYLPWEPAEQLTKNAHNLLTIDFRDPAGADQRVVSNWGTTSCGP